MSCDPGLAVDDFATLFASLRFAISRRGGLVSTVIPPFGPRAGATLLVSTHVLSLRRQLLWLFQMFSIFRSKKLVVGETCEHLRGGLNLSPLSWLASHNLKAAVLNTRRIMRKFLYCLTRIYRHALSIHIVTSDCGRLSRVSTRDLLTVASRAGTFDSAEKPESVLHLSGMCNFVLCRPITAPHVPSYDIWRQKVSNCNSEC